MAYSRYMTTLKTPLTFIWGDDKIMGRTSNAAKQRWNQEHYVQVKAYIKPEIAAAFKSVCAGSGSSMASELCAFMEEFARPPQDTAMHTKVKTLGDRRKTMRAVMGLLAEMRGAEESYVGGAPENLRNSARYAAARERIANLEEAVGALGDIYDKQGGQA